MIPVLIQPLNPGAAASLPNIGTLSKTSSNAPQVPPSIASQPPGTLIKGFVLNRAPGGQPVLRSNLGDFLLQSNAFLRIGSEVTIRVRAGGENFRAEIIQVDGKSVTAESQSKISGANGQAVSNSSDGRSANWQARQDTIQQTQALPNLDAAGNVRGNFSYQSILLNPSQEIVKNFKLQQGSSLILKLLNLQLPDAPTQSSAPRPAVSSQPNQASTQSTTTQAPSAAPPGVTPATLAPSGEAIKPITPQPLPQSTGQPAANSAPPAANTSNQAPPQVQSNLPHVHRLSVIGHESDGEPVLQTPFGLAKITSRANLPVGAQLSAQILLGDQQTENLLALPSNPNPASSPTSLFKLAHSWPALDQILQFLRSDSSSDTEIRALPQLSSTGAGTAAPNAQSTPAQFSGGFFLFFAALKGNNFKAFLGERTMERLQQAGQQNLLNQASAEFSQLSRLADTPNTPWQTMFFPALVDGQVQMVRWYSKNDQQEEGSDDASTQAKRFMIELNTSALGDLQLDGLYRPDRSQKKLELILRSHAPLSKDAQHDMITIMQDLSEATGIQGSIMFQATPHFPELPLETALQDIPDVIA